jgi:catalase
MNERPFSLAELVRHPGQHLGEIGRLGAIGVVVLAVGGAFVYVAGFAAPDRLSPQRIVNKFETYGGVHPGFRRNHAKGVCVAGYFEGNGKASGISRAEVFDPVRTPVIGRFAIPGPNPVAPDGGTPVRSFALEFQLPNHAQWRTGMNNTPVFAVNTPEAFYEQLAAGKPDPATGKPDPAKLKAFYAAHPETQPFQKWVKAHPPSSSFANAAYYSINAFRAIDADGDTSFIRWAMVPEAAYAPAKPSGNAPNYLSDELSDRLAQGPLRWHLILTVAAPGDVTNDATEAWPDDRRQIDAGTLTIEHETAQADGDCRDINYDPTVLPDGLKPSDDPLLAARSAAYAVSFNRRIREEAHGPAGSNSSTVEGHQ